MATELRMAMEVAAQLDQVRQELLQTDIQRQPVKTVC
jgi:hypothetical protein